MSLLTTLLLQINIEDKLKHAPDKSYEVGVFIGTMLPFILLVIIAYAIYLYNKKKSQ